jgi:hypothetical protein
MLRDAGICASCAYTLRLVFRGTYAILFRAMLLVAVMSTSQVSSARPGLRPPEYPWHLVDIWWTSPASTPSFSELAIDFEIVGDVPADVDLYIAPMGLVQIGGIDAYGGVQTSIRGWPSKTDRRLTPIGRGGIFSRWSVDDQPLPLDHATGPSGTHFEAADYENEFLSVRRRVAWNSGRYTYFLRRTKKTPGLWFTASVRELRSGRETEIGSLRFGSGDRSLGPSIAGFVEIYGTTSRIPELSVIFSEPRIDGKRRPGTTMSVVYPDHGTDGSVRYATASPEGTHVFIELMPAGVDNAPRKPRR